MTVCAEFAGRSWATCTRGIQGCVCGFDDLHRVARVLEVHNKWRRGDIEIDEAPCPSAVGKAIDAAIAHLRFNATSEGPPPSRPESKQEASGGSLH